MLVIHSNETSRKFDKSFMVCFTLQAFVRGI